ncbi:hypothetical protein V9K67_23360 [Paraflavisolibacter sp. H34]|uniref:hypothetical protein n=1 Tax=Huijunlia imazamoxiresistens TaxID=3127457 RepID=UPI00301A6FA4
MNIFRKAVGTLFFCLVLNTLFAQKGWMNIHHKNGFDLQLPSGFSRGLLVAAGTLQWYHHKQEGIELTVESFGPGTPEGLKESYLDDLKRFRGITYKVLKPTWYVISGQNEEGIFYYKSIRKDGELHHLRLSYPPAQKALFDSTLGRIATSFR